MNKFKGTNCGNYLYFNKSGHSRSGKIGRTENLEERVRYLCSHSEIPVPFVVYYACLVKDSVRVEKKIQHAFGDHRINPKRVLTILKHVKEENVTPENDYVENQEEKRSLDKELNRRSRFKFSTVDILVGSILYFIRDESVTAKVVDDQNIEFEGEVTSLY